MSGSSRHRFAARLSRESLDERGFGYSTEDE